MSEATREGNHEMTEIVGEARRRISRTASLDFLGTDIGLLRSLVESVPWEAILRAKESRRAGHSSRRKS